MTTLESLLDEAVALVTEAGAMTLRWFQTSDLEVDAKADGSPVTVADRAVEAWLRDEIARRHPQDAVVGEEMSDSVGTSDRTWIIDPIDGTKSFARGVPLYSTLLAVTDGDGPAVGVIGLPALGSVVAAARDLGCHADGSRCHVSPTATMAGACITMSGLEYLPPGLIDGLCAAGPLVRTWGDGYGWALLATGRVDAMVDPGLNPWDVAAMNVIVPEAGGVVTDFAGAPLPRSGDVVGSNGPLHRDLLKVVSRRV
ncbi:MAG: inositol monophosphatase family protein [Acidimicrobiales bacterium]